MTTSKEYPDHITVCGDFGPIRGYYVSKMVWNKHDERYAATRVSVSYKQKSEAVVEGRLYAIRANLEFVEL